jgi:OFA family oxalate/formate antiporter-like MFS transporter
LQTVHSFIFWIMYLDFVLVAASGLMVTAQLAPIANGFGIGKSTVNFLGYTVPALIFALSLNNLMNGFGRPLFGWLSDIIGRENTLTITLMIESLTVLCLGTYGGNPLIFVLLAALSFLVWGDIYSIFPALTSDQFGRKYASTNYALLYTAKGCAALFVPIGSIIAASTGNWYATLMIASLANCVAAALMFFVVRPLRAKTLGQSAAVVSTSAAD